VNNKSLTGGKFALLLKCPPVAGFDAPYDKTLYCSWFRSKPTGCHSKITGLKSSKIPCSMRVSAENTVVRKNALFFCWNQKASIFALNKN